MEQILQLKNVSKKFSDFSLKNISFSLDRGFIMGFIGPNGAGKSTTIKLIMNLMKKDSGDIRIFGLDNGQHELTIKQKIGFVYDENFFYEELTVEEMKNFIHPFYKNWREELFQKYAKEFHLPLKKQIKHLSKGMKMKFSLSIALSHDAELLIMDEPTSGLDPVVRSELLDILQTVIESGNKSVFFSTHITSDLEKVADYITFINDGEIILSKTKDELLDNYCIVKGNTELLSTIRPELFVHIHKYGYGFEALSNNKQQIIKEFSNEVVIEKPTLEDIMIFSIRSDSYVPSY